MLRKCIEHYCLGFNNHFPVFFSSKSSIKASSILSNPVLTVPWTLILSWKPMNYCNYFICCFPKFLSYKIWISYLKDSVPQLINTNKPLIFPSPYHKTFNSNIFVNEWKAIQRNHIIQFYIMQLWEMCYT